VRVNVYECLFLRLLSSTISPLFQDFVKHSHENLVRILALDGPPNFTSCIVVMELVSDAMAVLLTQK
jgi:hypothetical protein